MFDVVLPAGFENVQEARQVRGAVCAGIDQRIAYTRLRREIDDMGEFSLFEQRIHRRGISQIALDKAEVFLAPEHGEARVLQRRIVIGIEIVKAGDVVACTKQAAGDVKTDEASGSGDENL